MTNRNISNESGIEILMQFLVLLGPFSSFKSSFFEKIVPHHLLWLVSGECFVVKLAAKFPTLSQISFKYSRMRKNFNSNSYVSTTVLCTKPYIKLGDLWWYHVLAIRKHHNTLFFFIRTFFVRTLRLRFTKILRTC